MRPRTRMGSANSRASALRCSVTAVPRAGCVRVSTVNCPSAPDSQRTPASGGAPALRRSEEHTSELQSPCNLVCRLLLEKKKKIHPTQSRQLLHVLQPLSESHHPPTTLHVFRLQTPAIGIHLSSLPILLQPQRLDLQRLT